ncbi:MAG TPA: class I SAM-dependent methyltransferase [Terrimicrobiaceae bacterium]
MTELKEAVEQAKTSRRDVTKTGLSAPESQKLICPNCNRGRMEDFYEVGNIPVHSVLLMPTRERALDYPRRDLKLGFCPKCGFVANTIFDPTVHEYSTSCEESQGFSPTFNAFARSLAKRWVKQYHLQGKSVLEIGCGKGEFLVQMVEEGMARGIGIDPAFVPERLNTSAPSRFEFIQDLYSEKYSYLQADVICCRHTLEHIAPTAKFMQMIRRTIGDRVDTLLLFELPDVFRVLTEAAFWDIYYEHCSYFTTGSLARLFRQTGFELLELDVEYDGQYIVIAGRPSSQDTTAFFPGEADLEVVTREVARFASRFSDIKKHWLTTINGMRAEGRKVIVWGGGSKAVSFLTTLGLNGQIDYVVDINPHKHGKFIPGSGHAVKSPESLRDFRPDCVILMNPVYEVEVREMLSGMGLSPKILPV